MVYFIVNHFSYLGGIMAAMIDTYPAYLSFRKEFSRGILHLESCNLINIKCQVQWGTEAVKSVGSQFA